MISDINFQSGNYYPLFPLTSILYHKPDCYLSPSYVLMGSIIIMRAYEKMTAVFDGYGEMVTDPDEIIPAIKREVANGKPSIINVEVDHESLSAFIAGVKNMVNVYYLER